MPMIKGGTREHLLHWKGGPEIYCRLVGGLARHHPGLMRLVFAAKAALGLWLPVHQLNALRITRIERL